MGGPPMSGWMDFRRLRTAKFLTPRLDQLAEGVIVVVRVVLVLALAVGAARRSRRSRASSSASRGERRRGRNSRSLQAARNCISLRKGEWPAAARTMLEAA